MALLFVRIAVVVVVSDDDDVDVDISTLFLPLFNVLNEMMDSTNME